MLIVRENGQGMLGVSRDYRTMMNFSRSCLGVSDFERDFSDFCGSPFLPRPRKRKAASAADGIVRESAPRRFLTGILSKNLSVSP